MRIQKRFFANGLLALLMVLMAMAAMSQVPFASAQGSKIGTVPYLSGTQYNNSRRTFWAAGLNWVWYSNGINFVYSTSADGTSWSSSTSVGACTDGYNGSVWFDGTYVYYIRYTSYKLYFRRGTPNSNGTISWSQAEQTVYSGTSTDYYRYPTIAVDNIGYVWIGATYYNGSTYTPYVLKDNKNDGTWTNAPSFPYQLSTTSNSSWSVSVVPMANGKVYAIYAYSGKTGSGNLWNGSSWNARENTMGYPNAGYESSAVADSNDNIYLVYYNGYGRISYLSRNYSAGIWSTEETVQSGLTSYMSPVLSIDRNTNNLYCFWENNNCIVYKVHTASTNTWSTSPVLFQDETADKLSAAANSSTLSCSYQAYGGAIEVEYETKVATPYNLKFASLALAPPAPDFTISVSPTSGSVNQGGSVSTTVSLTSVSGFSSTTSLTSSGLPSGATATFTPSSGAPSFTSTLTISTDSTTPTGTYTITITGTGGGKTHTTTFSLTMYIPPNVPTNLLPTARQTTLSPKISAYCDDNVGNSVTVYFYDNSNGKLIGSQSVGIGGTASVTWSGLTNGKTYTFYAIGKDNNGIWGSKSATCSFVINIPILINGNSRFTGGNGVNGGGNGTAGNPYIIENYVINASGANGISIQNTTAYFIIRNCLVENGGSTYNGIQLSNVINGVVMNNTSDNNKYGIYTYNSSYDNISFNTCSYNYEGILCSWLSNSTISNNTCNNNTFIGIYLNNSCINDNLDGNSCLNNVYGIYLMSDNYNILSNNICENNENGTYSGSGIVLSSSFYNNIVGNTCGSENKDGIVLYSSSNNNLTNNVCIGNNFDGIFLYNSSNYNVLTSNTVENNLYGIQLSSVNHNTVNNNTFLSNNSGIYLTSDKYETITGNTCENNNVGIWLYKSSNDNLNGNTCNNNSEGILLSYSDTYNTLNNNTCKNNSDMGIFLSFSSYNTLVGNECDNNSAYGIYLYSSPNNTLNSNTCSNNSSGIYLSPDYYWDFATKGYPYPNWGWGANKIVENGLFMSSVGSSYIGTTFGINIPNSTRWIMETCAEFTAINGPLDNCTIQLLTRDSTSVLNESGIEIYDNLNNFYVRMMVDNVDQIIPDQHAPFTFQTNTWYTLALKFDNGTIYAYIDNTLYFSKSGLYQSSMAYTQPHFTTEYCDAIFKYMKIWNLNAPSSNNTLTFNNCSGNSYGIYILKSDNNTLTGNHLANNATPYVDSGTNNQWSGKPYYLTLTTSPSVGASLTGAGWYDSGASASISTDNIVPIDSGSRYRFNGWTTDNMDEIADASSTSTTVTMDSAKTVTANYIMQYYLTVTSPYGTTGGDGWYDNGTTANATVTPLIVYGPPGVQYVFTNWSGDSTGTTSPSDPIIMNAPKTAIANWETQ